MTVDDRHCRMDAARTQARLGVQDLWLAYLGLGGTADAFEIDGYLQGLMPLEPFQQEVLAQALNDALIDQYDAFRIPSAEPAGPDNRDQDRLRTLVNDLLDQPFGWTATDRPPAGQAL